MKRLLLLIFLPCLLNASVPPLEREISLNLNKEKLASALEKIQDQTQLVFSYQAALISTVSPVTISLRNKTVREALLLLLPRNITFKAKNNYIILKPKPKEKDTTTIQISGYVYEQNSEKKVPNVTIYDKQTLQSATTDEYGFYTMTVPAETRTVTVIKDAYKDTALAVQEIRTQPIVNFTIQPLSYLRQLRDSLKIREKLNEVGDLSKKAFADFKGYINSLNIKDTLTRPAQVSFLPFIGTNHRMSGAVYNHLSFNVLGGFSRGLKGFEVGGLFNIEKESVDGAQFAGLINIVGDSVKGTQVAGLLNVDGLYAAGFQAAGLMNINGRKQQGIQVAGLMNISKKSEGFSAAGLMNVAESASGMQAAGLANISDTLRGVAASGLFNVCDYSGSSVQLSPIFNVSGSGSTIMQGAVFFNRCSLLKGTQLAFVNVADSATGVPFGLLSVVRKGLHQVEISYDELFPVNIALRTGVNAFYNSISFGVRPGTPYWYAGYGIGTSVPLHQKLKMDLSATVQHVSKGGLYWSASEAYRLYWGLDFHPTKKFGIAAGPTFNLYITDLLTPEYASGYSGFTPKPMQTVVTPYDFRYKTWVGMRVALRFF